MKSAEQALTPQGGSSAASSKTQGERVFASPLARRMAAQAGVDLKSIKGTGPHGRIVKRDVEGAGQLSLIHISEPTRPY